MAALLRTLTISSICLLVCLLVVTSVSAAPKQQLHELTVEPFEVDRVGLVGDSPQPQKASADTTWAAIWDFDSPGGICDDSGWTTIDRRNPLVAYNANLYWQLRTDFSGVGGIQGRAGVFAHADPCWTFPEGYDNDWYQAIEIPYLGISSISFDYLIDSEAGFDFLSVEIDSACASRDLEYSSSMEARPWSGAGTSYRTQLWSLAGFDTTGSVDSLLLGDFGAASDTHCVYVSFSSDGAFSPADGLQSTTLGIAVALDNLELTGGLNLQEDFEGTLDPRITPLNMYIDRDFGDWARLYQHITDNDFCVENTTCAWLWTDDQTPTIANDPSEAFGPGSYVVKGWLDNAILSPWVSLSVDPSVVGAVFSFRRFPGSFFSTTRRVQGWSVRGKKKVENTVTPAPGDSIVCVSPWSRAFQHNSLSSYTWKNLVWDMTADFDPASTEVQVRIKTEDWQFLAGASPPHIWQPAPGPYIDDVRIGRIVQVGPLFDANNSVYTRYQAQDAFPTQPLAGTTGGVEPTMDRFGTTAFSRSGDLAANSVSPRLITGDSITVDVVDVLGNGGVTAVEWCGAIVAGPHAGKAPPPYTVQPNGFFSVMADSARDASGQVVADRYFVDVDDNYFRGGDVLYYFWRATDAMSQVSSYPAGIQAEPVDVQEAEDLTGGLFEVSFLPTINWDAGYLVRIAADAHGKLDPTAQELVNSQQATCILYSQLVNPDRRSGDANRTTFMYTLDRLGYAGLYDVYDHQGLGNVNNQLGGRATIEQAEGYALVIHDAGLATPGTPILPNGVDIDSEKIDMHTWFTQYLAAGLGSEAGSASLWIIGENAQEEFPIDFYPSVMHSTWQSSAQSTGFNPAVVGLASSYTFASGATADFTTDTIQLNGGCPTIRGYDELGAAGTGVVTHRYEEGAAVGGGAVVMASDATTQNNTVMMSLVWSDIVRATGGPGTSPAQVLAQKILDGVLPNGCAGTPTDVGDDDVQVSAPRQSALHQNHPNPFNPTTRIVFDLARDGRVRLTVYDVAGRRVRQLHDGVRSAGYAQSVVWDGRNDAGERLGNGVYFYRLEAGNFAATRKLVLMK